MIADIGTFPPETLITCCFFHLVQSIWRNFQLLSGEVVNKYREDSELSLEYRLLSGLVFVPIADLREVLEEITTDIIRTDPCLTSLVKYFEHNYVGTTGRGVRFPIALWNQYERVDMEMLRTNNTVKIGICIFLQ